MPLTIEESKKGLVKNARVWRYATLWKIERTDGTSFYFTDFNQPIEFTDGQTYIPINSINASARDKQDGLAANNLEVIGVLDSSAITNDDIRAGKFSDATITEYLVDWRYPFLGEILKAVHYLTDIDWEDNLWVGQVEGLTRKLRRRVGLTVTRDCRHNLGDAQCGVNVASHTITGTITSVLATSIRRAFFASAISSQIDDYFTYGVLTFTSGNNNGLSAEVQRYTNTGRFFKLQTNMPYDIEAGDTFSVYPGCGKLRGYCKGADGDKGRPWANNIANFGGFPDMPGTDRMIQYPDSTA